MISAAGNTIVPCYLALIEKGYSVTVDSPNTEKELWRAKKGELVFVGSDPIELLAMSNLFEVRGEAWKATDEEIDAFEEQYGL